MPALLVVVFGCMLGAPAFADSLVSDLDSDETILFYPTLAVPATNGGWDVRVHGCVFELEKRRLSLAALRGILRLDSIKMTEAELATFKSRAGFVLADNERNHRVVARVGGQVFDLGKTAPSGHFEKLVHVHGSNAPVSVFEINAVLSTNDLREFAGFALVLPRTGLSVVSDIDDTIKISEVRNHDALLRRTFLQPFESVPDMAALYRAWATNGAQFHYVSASPWQLHLPLIGFTATNDFPQGSWHMKLWRTKDRTFRALFQDPEKYKVETIAPLLERFSGRQFVLVGDSGERDPEAYAALARKFPAQVKAIFIRDVTGQGADAERYQTNFSGLPRDLWRVFKEPSEIAPLLPGN